MIPHSTRISTDSTSLDQTTTTFTVPITLHYAREMSPEQQEAEAARLFAYVARQFPAVDIRRTEVN